MVGSFLSACVDGSTAASGSAGVRAEVRDSAGVQITELAPDFMHNLSQWQLAPSPSVSIGVVEGQEPYSFGRVAAARLPDGSIAALELLTGEVRVFDQGGSFVGRFGRQGEGPGESSASGVRLFSMLRPNHMALWDLGLRRATVFEREGSIVRTFSTAGCAPQGGAPVGCLRALGFTSDSAVVFADRDLVATPASEGPSSGEVVKLGIYTPSAYHAVDSVRQQTIHSIVIAGESRFFRELFGGAPIIGVGPDRVVVGRGDERDLRVRGGDGQLLRIIRFPAPRPVTDADRHMYDSVPVVWGEQWEAFAERWLRDAPEAGVYPNFGDRVRVDTTGRIWLADFAMPRVAETFGERTWTVFDIEGRPIARVVLPETDDFLLQQIDEDAVLAVVRDSLGVNSIGLFPIEGAGAG